MSSSDEESDSSSSVSAQPNPDQTNDPSSSLLKRDLNNKAGQDSMDYHSDVDSSDAGIPHSTSGMSSLYESPQAQSPDSSVYATPTRGLSPHPDGKSGNWRPPLSPDSSIYDTPPEVRRANESLRSASSISLSQSSLNSARRAMGSQSSLRQRNGRGKGNVEDDQTTMKSDVDMVTDVDQGCSGTDVDGTDVDTGYRPSSATQRDPPVPPLRSSSIETMEQYAANKKEDGPMWLPTMQKVSRSSLDVTEEGDEAVQTDQVVPVLTLAANGSVEETDVDADRRQSASSSIITGARRNSFKQATNGQRTTSDDPAVEMRRSMLNFDIEADTSADTKDTNIVLKHLRRLFSCIKTQKHAQIAVVLCVLGLLLLLFLSLFPVSFVKLEYYQLALKRSKLTRAVDKNTTYLPGCYVLGPDAELILFPGTANFMSLSDLSVQTSDRLIVTFDVTFQYFLRPDELGEVYANFAMDYHNVIKLLATSVIKNTISKFSLDEMRLKRAEVEIKLHRAIQRKIGGTCCPKCCSAGKCTGRSLHLCIGCEKSTSCSLGMHVDVTFFQLGALIIPEEVQERLLRRVTIQVEGETERFNLDYAVTVKQTEQQVQSIINAANEIEGNSTAVASLIEKQSHASYDKVLQNATVHGLKNMYSTLGMSKEDHKLSLYWINTLEKLDLIKSSNVGHDKSTLYSG